MDSNRLADENYVLHMKDGREAGVGRTLQFFGLSQHSHSLRGEEGQKGLTVKGLKPSLGMSGWPSGIGCWKPKSQSSGKRQRLEIKLGHKLETV